MRTRVIAPALLLAAAGAVPAGAELLPPTPNSCQATMVNVPNNFSHGCSYDSNAGPIGTLSLSVSQGSATASITCQVGSTSRTGSGTTTFIRAGHCVVRMRATSPLTTATVVGN